MNGFTILDNAISFALLMAARGLRPWWVWMGSDNWRARGSDTDCPASECSADRIIAAPECYVCYPTGLYVPVAQVNWVWWIEEEKQYRQGSAFQAQRYATRKNLGSPIAVAPDRLHGSQVREEGPTARAYRFVPSRSFPAWTGV